MYLYIFLLTLVLIPCAGLLTLLFSIHSCCENWISFWNLVSSVYLFLFSSLFLMATKLVLFNYFDSFSCVCFFFFFLCQFTFVGYIWIISFDTLHFVLHLITSLVFVSFWTIVIAAWCMGGPIVIPTSYFEGLPSDILIHPDFYIFDGFEIGMMQCPGKVNSKECRNLDQDLQVLVEVYHVGTLINLLTDSEIKELRIETLDQKCFELNINLLSFQQRDKWIPELKFFTTFCEKVALAVRDTRTVVFCRGGKGRTGLLTAIVATLLTKPCVTVLDFHIQCLRLTRPGCLQNPLQLIFAYFFIFFREQTRHAI